MVRPGLINLDFADVRAVMDEMGKAMMGTGEAEGETRAVEAAEKAIANPLLDEISLRGAKGVLINITGAGDLTLFELDEAANRIREEVDPEANIIVGSTLDTAMEGKMRVSVVATGIDAVEVRHDAPVPRRPMSAPLKQSVSVEDLRPAPLELEPAAQVPAEVEVVAQEPSLFEDMNVEQVAAHDQAEDIFEEPELVAEDGLPMPAYQPKVAEFQPQADVAHAPEQTFVAPKAPAVGTPSPEAIVRLQAAAQRVAPNAVEEAQHDAKQRGGFGLNSLIHRMTGQAGDTPVGAQRQQPVVQQQAAAPQQEINPEQERIEIPAFLRRQAN